MKKLVLACLLAAGLASAQMGGGGGMGGGGDMGGGGGRGGGGEMGGMGGGMTTQRSQTKMDVIADKLKLNKEQKEQVTGILNSTAESAAQLNMQLSNGRTLIAQAMVNAKDNGDDYNKLIGQYTAVLAQMDNLEATAYGKIYALLKPNQQKNAALVFTDVMAGIFFRQANPNANRRRSQ